MAIDCIGLKRIVIECTRVLAFNYSRVLEYSSSRLRLCFRLFSRICYSRIHNLEETLCALLEVHKESLITNRPDLQGSNVKLCCRTLTQETVVLDWGSVTFSPQLISLPPSVTPQNTISVTVTTPCTSPAAVVTWRYQQGVSSIPPSSTSSTQGSCPSGVVQTTNTLSLPGNTVSLSNYCFVFTGCEWHPSQQYMFHPGIMSIRSRQPTPCLYQGTQSVYLTTVLCLQGVSGIPPSSTSSTQGSCPSGQVQTTNTLSLPGNTVSLYNRQVSLTVSVEHDSFDPPTYTNLSHPTPYSFLSQLPR
ncbi:uncharacterized protein LOC124264398 [Haliotis rubra]|uniref:uncharacterized protein LOC124264398 n=1 Tax=Haliotis rubra TaxID=36100 RepID=UPI001EE6229C|nr:uncharacterized protein LOC124264398 [Haliotis rubra]